MSDDFSADEIHDEGTTLTLPEEPTETNTRPCCEKCNSPLPGHEAIACRQCGWYASINAFVEIDPNWEVATDPELEIEGANTANNTKVPTWAWVLMSCVSAMILGSLAVRLLTPADSIIRTNWSVVQLFLGTGLFASCHAIAFALLMKATVDTSITDIFLHPINSWAILFRELPRRQWVCHLGFSGLTAAAMSVLVIGGLPYEALLNWGGKAPPKQSLMAAVLSNAQGAAEEDDKSLEEAVGDFAGNAELDEDKKKKKKKPTPKDRQKTDCVILGYQTTSDGLIHSLFLGGENYGKLIYSGKVSLGLTVEENRELAEQLDQIKAKKPFVKVPSSRAHWVIPRFVCRISYKRKGERGGLHGAKLEELIGLAKMKGL